MSYFDFAGIANDEVHCLLSSVADVANVLRLVINDEVITIWHPLSLFLDCCLSLLPFLIPVEDLEEFSLAQRARVFLRSPIVEALETVFVLAAFWLSFLELLNVTLANSARHVLFLSLSSTLLPRRTNNSSKPLSCFGHRC